MRGRKPHFTGREIKSIELRLKNKISITKIAEEFKVSRVTIYKYIAKLSSGIARGKDNKFYTKKN